MFGLGSVDYAVGERGCGVFRGRSRSLLLCLRQVDVLCNMYIPGIRPLYMSCEMVVAETRVSHTSCTLKSIVRLNQSY